MMTMISLMTIMSMMTMMTMMTMMSMPNFRYLVAVLGSVGMGIIYGLKVNISVAIVAMVNHTALGNKFIYKKII